MATYHDAARIVAGAQPPPSWLIDALSVYGAVLKTARQNEAKRPSRKTMKKRLADLRKAAGIVVAAFEDPQTVTMLSAFTPDPGCLSDIWAGNSDVVAAAERAESSLAATSGPDHARVRSEIQPQVVCAVIISIVIERFSGTYPTGRSKCDQMAAEALWQASGGPEFTGHARINPISWENAFKGRINASPGFLSALQAMLRNRQ